MGFLCVCVLSVRVHLSIARFQTYNLCSKHSCVNGFSTWPLGYRPWTGTFCHTVCILSAIFTQLGQVELSLQSHLQSASVDQL